MKEAMSIRSGRAHAVVSWVAAAMLMGLILLLAGALPWWGALDDVLSVGTAASALVVLALVYSEVRDREPWAIVGLVLAVAGMSLVLAGDALQHVVFHSPPGAGIDTATVWAVTFAVRDWLGNGLFYASLIVLGGLLMTEGRRWVGALAIANGALGYLDLAFAPALGLPPHTNFLLVVVWEIALGIGWWRWGCRVAPDRGRWVSEPERAAGVHATGQAPA
jgi:hypothetical protein